jgi:hypothetical protein
VVPRLFPSFTYAGDLPKYGKLAGAPGQPLSAHGSQVGQLNPCRHNAEVEDSSASPTTKINDLALRWLARWSVRDFCVRKPYGPR